LDLIDLKTLHTRLFTAPAGEFVLVDVPELMFLKVDGTGPQCRTGICQSGPVALFGGLWCEVRGQAALKQDFVVPPLEGLWHSDDPSSFVDRRKSEWFWTMMIDARLHWSRTLRRRCRQGAREAGRCANIIAAGKLS
jgi:hypothetical protein